MTNHEIKMIRAEIIKVNLISLKARKDACRNYELNQAMQIEANILEKQIEALETELAKTRGSIFKG